MMNEDEGDKEVKNKSKNNLQNTHTWCYTAYRMRQD